MEIHSQSNITLKEKHSLKWSSTDTKRSNASKSPKLNLPLAKEDSDPPMSAVSPLTQAKSNLKEQ